MTDTNDIVAAQRTLLPEPAYQEPDAAVGSVAAALRRRWRTFILIVTLSCVSSLAAVWTYVRPMYEVRAQLRVAPIVAPILFKDADTDISRQYGMHMATQSTILVSPSVIQGTLDLPEVRSLPSIRTAANPAGKIGRHLSVEQERGTELLRVTMTGETPDDMAMIVNSLLKTYLRLRENKKRETDDKIVASLRAEQSKLEVKLDRKSDQMRRLAAESGLSSTEQAQTAVNDWMNELRQLLAEANRNLAIVNAKLEKLDEDEDGEYPTQNDPAAFERYLQSDSELQDLKTALRTLELGYLEDERYGRGPSHPAVKGRATRIAAFRKAADARQSRLSELYSVSLRRRLEVQRLEVEMAAKLYQEQLAGLPDRQAEIARQTFLLDDLKHERERLEGDLSHVKQTIWKVELEQNRMARVTIESPAIAPSRPNIDKRMKYSAAAVMMSFLFAAGVALLRDRTDTSVRDPAEVTDRLGMPLLGSVQRVPVVNGAGPIGDERILEPLRGISVALLASSGNGKAQSRLITSPTAQSGKSSLAMNLARTLAATGRRVLLLDADNAGQGVTRACEMVDRKGLRELLDKSCSAEEATHSTDLPGLCIVPAGRHVEHFSAILTRRDAQASIRSLFEGYEEVIVDSPPVLASSDAIALATLVDEVILVLRAGSSTREEAHAARHHLSAVGGKLVGVILNAVDPKTVQYGYSGYAYTANRDTTQM